MDRKGPRPAAIRWCGDVRAVLEGEPFAQDRPVADEPPEIAPSDAAA
jgi:hypothetical protein